MGKKARTIDDVRCCGLTLECLIRCRKLFVGVNNVSQLRTLSRASITCKTNSLSDIAESPRTLMLTLPVISQQSL